MVAALSKHPGQRIQLLVAMGDPEADQLAMQFFRIFTDSGWDPRGPDMVMAVPPLVGIKLTINEHSAASNQPPPGLRPLFEKLLEFGLLRGPQISSKQDVPLGEIMLSIGAKPL